MIFKWYRHLMWWTKCSADWQEGFRPWHQSPHMSAMMTLNFVKWDNPSSLLPFFLPWLHVACCIFPPATSRWQSCYPDPGCEAARLQAEFWTVQGLTMCKSTPVLQCLAAEGERGRKERKREAAQITGSLALSQQTHTFSHMKQHNNKAHPSSVNRQSVLPWTFSLITVTAV